MQNFEAGIEAKGAAAMVFLISGTVGKSQRETILKNNGIEQLKEEGWYSLESIVGAFKELGATIGEMNLFLVGKLVMEHAPFPPMDGLESALKSIDVAYHMNHKKNGKVMFDPSTGQMTEGIGHYQLTKFDGERCTAEMICHTPYPSKFEEGLILQIVRRFKPEGALFPKVELDSLKETRRKGGETCTFKISWG